MMEMTGEQNAAKCKLCGKTDASDCINEYCFLQENAAPQEGARRTSGCQAGKRTVPAGAAPDAGDLLPEFIRKRVEKAKLEAEHPQGALKAPDLRDSLEEDEMNRHIIVEIIPGQMRRNIMAALLSCSMFFTLGFVGRPFMEWQWNQLVGNAENARRYCADGQTAGTPKRTLQWRLPDEKNTK